MVPKPPSVLPPPAQWPPPPQTPTLPYTPLSTMPSEGYVSRTVTFEEYDLGTSIQDQYGGESDPYLNVDFRLGSTVGQPVIGQDTSDPMRRLVPAGAKVLSVLGANSLSVQFERPKSYVNLFLEQKSNAAVVYNVKALGESGDTVSEYTIDPNSTSVLERVQWGHWTYDLTTSYMFSTYGGVWLAIDNGNYGPEDVIKSLEIAAEDVDGGLTEFAIDDLSFGSMSVPEPSTAVIWMLLAGTGVCVRRMRQRLGRDPRQMRDRVPAE